MSEPASVRPADVSSGRESVRGRDRSNPVVTSPPACVRASVPSRRATPGALSSCRRPLALPAGMVWVWRLFAFNVRNEGRADLRVGQ